LVTCGVFDRLPKLRFIIGDGSVDVARVMMWRVDRDWRQGRVEIPWVEKLPSSYMADHVRFVSQAEDGTNDGFEVHAEQVRIADAENLVMYGSHYPYWDNRLPDDVLPGLEADVRDRLLSGNALAAIPRLATHMTAQKSTTG
jgi:predicted TIM-barrel fold metal-dependent hydrolase